MRTRLLTIAVLGVSSAACTHTPPAATAATATPAASPAATVSAIAPIEPNAAVQKEWDPALAALIGRATRMDAARVKSVDGKWTPGPETHADALSRRTAAAILTKTTDKKKRCGFEPGVALRLCDDKNACATVLVCFHCGDLAVQKPDGGLTETLDFQDSRDEFAAIVKAALPDDAELQTL